MRLQSGYLLHRQGKPTSTGGVALPPFRTSWVVLEQPTHSVIRLKFYNTTQQQLITNNDSSSSSSSSLPASSFDGLPALVEKTPFRSLEIGIDDVACIVTRYNGAMFRILRSFQVDNSGGGRVEHVVEEFEPLSPSTLSASHWVRAMSKVLAMRATYSQQQQQQQLVNFSTSSAAAAAAAAKTDMLMPAATSTPRARRLLLTASHQQNNVISSSDSISSDVFSARSSDFSNITFEPDSTMAAMVTRNNNNNNNGPTSTPASSSSSNHHQNNHTATKTMTALQQHHQQQQQQLSTPESSGIASFDRPMTTIISSSTSSSSAGGDQFQMSSSNTTPNAYNLLELVRSQRTEIARLERLLVASSSRSNNNNNNNNSSNNEPATMMTMMDEATDRGELTEAECEIFRMQEMLVKGRSRLQAVNEKAALSTADRWRWCQAYVQSILGAMKIVVLEQRSIERLELGLSSPDLHAANIDALLQEAEMPSLKQLAAEGRFVDEYGFVHKFNNNNNNNNNNQPAAPEIINFAAGMLMDYFSAQSSYSTENEMFWKIHIDMSKPLSEATLENALLHRRYIPERMRADIWRLLLQPDVTATRSRHRHDYYSLLARTAGFFGDVESDSSFLDSALTLLTGGGGSSSNSSSPTTNLMMDDSTMNNLNSSSLNSMQLMDDSSTAAGNIIRRQILVDIRRTLPNNIHFGREGRGLTCLYRVLVSFARHKPTLGYCQGINFIAAVLLLILENEEEVFWSLVVLTENDRFFGSRQFDSRLTGVRADQKCVVRLMSKHLPGLHRHIEKHGTDLSTCFIPWLMCGFYDCVPFRTLLRIWDYFFMAGYSVFYRVAVALMKLQESSLVEMTDPTLILKHIKLFPHLCHDFTYLLKVAFEDLGSQASSEPWPSWEDLLVQRKKNIASIEKQDIAASLAFRRRRTPSRSLSTLVASAAAAAAPTFVTIVDADKFPQQKQRLFVWVDDSASTASLLYVITADKPASSSSSDRASGDDSSADVLSTTTMPGFPTNEAPICPTARLLTRLAGQLVFTFTQFRPNRALISTVQSASLACLDLDSGCVVWSFVPSSATTDDIYAAGIYEPRQDVIYLVTQFGTVIVLPCAELMAVQPCSSGAGGNNNDSCDPAQLKTSAFRLLTASPVSCATVLPFGKCSSILLVGASSFVYRVSIDHPDNAKDDNDGNDDDDDDDADEADQMMMAGGGVASQVVKIHIPLMSSSSSSAGVNNNNRPSSDSDVKSASVKSSSSSSGDTGGDMVSYVRQIVSGMSEMTDDDEMLFWWALCDGSPCLLLYAMHKTNPLHCQIITTLSGTSCSLTMAALLAPNVEHQRWRSAMMPIISATNIKNTPQPNCILLMPRPQTASPHPVASPVVGGAFKSLSLMVGANNDDASNNNNTDDNGDNNNNNSLHLVSMNASNHKSSSSSSGPGEGLLVGWPNGSIFQWQIDVDKLNQVLSSSSSSSDCNSSSTSAAAVEYKTPVSPCSCGCVIQPSISVLPTPPKSFQVQLAFHKNAPYLVGLNPNTDNEGKNILTAVRKALASTFLPSFGNNKNNSKAASGPSVRLAASASSPMAASRLHSNRQSHRTNHHHHHHQQQQQHSNAQRNNSLLIAGGGNGGASSFTTHNLRNIFGSQNNISEQSVSSPLSTTFSSSSSSSCSSSSSPFSPTAGGAGTETSPPPPLVKECKLINCFRLVSVSNVFRADCPVNWLAVTGSSSHDQQQQQDTKLVWAFQLEWAINKQQQQQEASSAAVGHQMVAVLPIANTDDANKLACNNNNNNNNNTGKKGDNKPSSSTNVAEINTPKTTRHLADHFFSPQQRNSSDGWKTVYVAMMNNKK